MDEQILKAELKSLLERSNSLLLNKRQSTKFRKTNVVYWPLFLTENSPVMGEYENEVLDSCATSEGLIAFYLLNINNFSNEEKQIITDAIESILLMRNKNGSWPSFLYVGATNEMYLEGIINDTCYAINALIDVGFLKEIFTFPINTSKNNESSDFSSISNRLNYILQSIDWLINNRINNAWYYTGKEKIEIDSAYSPSLSPSISAINTLIKVKIAITELANYDKNIISNIDEVINSSIRAVLQMQASDGSFGKQRGDSGKIAHTCLSIIMLLQLQSNNYEVHLMKAIKWLLRNKKVLQLNQNMASESFDEYFQIKSDDNIDFKKRSIHHENYLDATLLHAYAQISISAYWSKFSLYEKYRISKGLQYLIYNMIEKQNKTGNLAGAFISRRSFPNELYPIYAIERAVTSISLIYVKIDTIFRTIKYRKRLFFRLLLGLLAFPIIYIIIHYKVFIENNSNSLWITLAVGVFCNALYDIIKKIINPQKNTSSYMRYSQ